MFSAIMFSVLKQTFRKDWRRQSPTPQPATTDTFDVIASQPIENAADLQAWRAFVLDDIREHVTDNDINRFDPGDLPSDDFVPAPPPDTATFEEQFGLTRIFTGREDEPAGLSAAGIAQALRKNARTSGRSRRRRAVRTKKKAARFDS
jgi:hypothetical protein